VEGWKDAYQIQGALKDADFGIIVTDGTKMNNALAGKINQAIEDGYTPYTLSDPDEAGDQLAGMISNFFPNIERIDADYEECKYCKNIWKTKFKAGIEYASYRYLRKLLGPYL
jgi:5S rRNA maturation endonuclease (ribonuclease M5)